jgi:hypothetical protein
MKIAISIFSFLLCTAALAGDNGACAHAGYYNLHSISCTLVDPVTGSPDQITQVDECADGDWGTLVLKTNNNQWMSDLNSRDHFTDDIDCSSVNFVCGSIYVVNTATGVLYKKSNLGVTDIGHFSCQYLQ